MQVHAGGCESAGWVASVRELFHELTADAFAIAKAMLEEAIKKARPPESHHRQSRVAKLAELTNRGPLGGLLCRQYGWERVVMYRTADRDAVTICVRLPCGHSHRFSYSDATIEASTPSHCMTLIERGWDSVKAPCYCVRRWYDPTC